MLRHLSIENIALIQRLNLEFGAGLTILTGETGAGKSILVDALALVLGARADTGLVRAGMNKAKVVVCFQPPGDHPVWKWLQGHDLEGEGGEIWVRRVLSGSGRSRAFVNETPVPLSTLSQLGRFLVEIHGQHDHQILLDPGNHLVFLDEFADHPTLVRETTEQYEKWRGFQKELADLQRRTRDAADREAFLSYQLNELETAEITPGELSELEGRQGRLAHATRLAQAAAAARALMTESPQAAAVQTGQAAAVLEKVVLLDPALVPIAETVRSLQYELEDVADRTRHYQDGLETDPDQLEQLEERIDLIRRLSRKYRREADQLALLAEQWRNEIDALERIEQDEAQLRKDLEAAREAFAQKALLLGRSRKKSAKRLGEAVEGQLGELHMAQTRFAVVLQPHAGDPRPMGMETAAFQVSSNPGQPLKPLKQVASGGELSRITLALRTLLSHALATPTLIFDEVDVGVGGRVAAGIGSKLARVAEGRQALVITHLPQVAAWGRHHMKVEKITAEGQTRVLITPLDGKGRVEELARMLAGNQVTAPARRNAQVLLEAARMGQTEPCGI